MGSFVSKDQNWEWVEVEEATPGRTSWSSSNHGKEERWHRWHSASRQHPSVAERIEAMGSLRCHTPVWWGHWGVTLCQHIQEQLYQHVTSSEGTELYRGTLSRVITPHQHHFTLLSGTSGIIAGSYSYLANNYFFAVFINLTWCLALGRTQQNPAGFSSAHVCEIGVRAI